MYVSVTDPFSLFTVVRMGNGWSRSVISVGKRLSELVN